jgi:hypothetical protein
LNFVTIGGFGSVVVGGGSPSGSSGPPPALTWDSAASVRKAGLAVAVVCEQALARLVVIEVLFISPLLLLWFCVLNTRDLEIARYPFIDQLADSACDGKK